MTEKRPAGGKPRDTRPATIQGLATSAARLLDRLRKEPLPDDAQEAAALRIATRNAFLLVEELRTLAAEEAPISAISRPVPQKKTAKDRPFFPFFDEPSNDPGVRADNGRRKSHKRAGRKAAAGKRA